MANLQVVADAAGVHRSTASRALNPTTAHLVARPVAARIQMLAETLGYRADPVAASLRTKRSRMVGLVLPDMANPVFGPILAGIENALAERGYSVIIAHAGTDGTRQRDTVDALMMRRVDGLILATARAKDDVVAHCLAAGTPTVLVNRMETKPRASASVSDDREGLRLAVRHLVALGHHGIAHLAGPRNVSTGALRRRGFLDAMREAGLEPGPIAEATAYTREAGRLAAARLLDDPTVTAIAAANDLLALGAYQEIFARGLRCPHDVSVTGHNDMPIADMVAPPLTSVRIGHEALGREAAALLLAEIEGGANEPIVKVMQPVLIERGSTAAVG